MNLVEMIEAYLANPTDWSAEDRLLMALVRTGPVRHAGRIYLASHDGKDDRVESFEEKAIREAEEVEVPVTR